MEGFYNKTLSKLEMAIKELEIDANNPLQRIETIISKIVSCLSEVKKYVLKEGFKDLEEEVYFFKYQKPVIVAKLIYYNTIYKIEAKKPFGGKQVMEACLNEKLVKLKRFRKKW
ncbi:RteC domain-containing protein [Leadbetterella sp. DM7]|uniref:RteC domain-containing protein n=1 Tax=Leadbetterella sp. DM7 TaxID=3235085 RepID=UPI00349EFA96